jgi:hypothetical protein
VAKTAKTLPKPNLMIWGILYGIAENTVYVANKLPAQKKKNKKMNLGRVDK